MSTLEERILRLEDVEAIRRLKAYYGKYADAKYTDDHQRRPQAEIDTLAREQASVFTEDAIWDNGVGPSGILRGREANGAVARPDRPLVPVWRRWFSV